METFELFHKTENLSLFNLIEKICEKISDCDQNRFYTKLKKQLFKVAWEFILKKNLLGFSGYGDLYNNDIFSTVSWMVCEKIRKDSMYSTEERIDIIDKLFLLDNLHQSSEFNWIEDILKLIFLLSFFRLNCAASKEETNSFRERVLIWVENVEKHLLKKSSSEFCLRTKIFKFPPNASSDIAEPQPNKLRYLIRESKSWTFEESLSEPESIDAVLFSPSICELDEGFVTPSQEVIEDDQIDQTVPHEIHGKEDIIPFDAEVLNLQNIIQHYSKWDISHLKLEKEHPFFTLEGETSEICTSSQKMIYISREDLFYDIRAMLLGIQSNSFYKHNKKFRIKDGLYTDGIGPKILSEACAIFMKAGENYLALEELCPILNLNECSIIRSLKPTLNKYMYKYQSVIRKYKESGNILQLQKYVRPLASQIDFLVGCLTPLPKGVLLLNHLFKNLRMTPLSTFHVLVNLFVSCCQAYYSLLDRWVFLGQCHPDLSFVERTDICDIDNRESFFNSYLFSPEKAPIFIPAKEVFQCGLCVAQLHLCSKNQTAIPQTIEFAIERPQISLYLSFESQIQLKEKCEQFFSYCSSVYPPVPRWFPEFDTDLTELTKKRALITANLINKRRMEHKLFCEQKKLKEFKCQKEYLQLRIESSMRKLQEELAYDKKIKAQAAFEEQRLASQRENFRAELINHYEKMAQITDKSHLLIEWKMKRFALTEKRVKFLEHDNGITDSYVSSTAKIDSKINEDGPMNLAIPKQDMSVLSQKYTKESDNLDSQNCIPYDGEGQEQGYNKIPQTMSDMIEFIKDQNTDTSEPNNDQAELHIFNSGTVPLSPDNKVDTTEVQNINTSLTCKHIPEKVKEISYSDKLREKFKTHTYDSSLDHFNTSMNPIEIETNVQKSLKIPLQMQIKIVNESLLRVFLLENKLLHHISAIRKYFFLSDGTYGNRLTSPLFTALEKKMPAELLTFTNLGNILQSACLDNIKELSFEVSETPVAFDLSDPRVLNCLKLSYKAYWPLNIILTEQAIAKYNTVFSFVLAIERASWYLKKLYCILRIKNVDLINTPQYKQLQLHRHVMSQYICALKCYMVITVFESCWTTFAKSMSQVCGIEELYKVHVKYIKDVRFKCFLNQSSGKMLDQIMKLLHTILVYCQVFEYGDIEVSPSGEFIHQKYAKLNHTFSNFMTIANYFTYLIQHLAQNQHHMHFDVLLQFLRNNSFTPN